MNRNVLLEVCCGDIGSAEAAYCAGTRRIELCCGLDEGGLTPSPATLHIIKSRFPELKVHVLLRPRPGDFLYSPLESEQICREAESDLFAEADGLVFGALLPDGSIDTALCRRVAEAAKGRSLTFHRAFDMTADPEKALEEVIALGYDRILTSGLAPTSAEGIDTIIRLSSLADGRISIMAGGGINADNAREIARSAGLSEVHASASECVGSTMAFRRDDVKMGSPEADEFSRRTTSEKKVAAILAALSNP